MPTEANTDKLYWFAMYRGAKRKVTDMVVAWLNEAELALEVEKYASWDARASGNTDGWEIERFTRRLQDSYYRPGDDHLIDYHLLLEDRARAELQGGIVLFQSVAPHHLDR